MICKRIRAIVHGKVQGVAFREYTRREAVRLGLSGWVRNASDGTVEILFEGEATQVDTLLKWLNKGSPYAHVSQVEQKDEPLEGEADGFFIHL